MSSSQKSLKILKYIKIALLWLIYDSFLFEAVLLNWRIFSAVELNRQIGDQGQVNAAKNIQNLKKIRIQDESLRTEE